MAAEDLGDGTGNGVVLARQRSAHCDVEIRIARHPGSAAVGLELVLYQVNDALADLGFDRLDVEQDVCVGDIVVARLACPEAPAGNGGVLVRPDLLGHGVLQLRDDAHGQRDGVDADLGVDAVLAGTAGDTHAHRVGGQQDWP